MHRMSPQFRSRNMAQSLGNNVNGVQSLGPFVANGMSDICVCKSVSFSFVGQSRWQNLGVLTSESPVKAKHWQREVGIVKLTGSKLLWCGETLLFLFGGWFLCWNLRLPAWSYKNADLIEIL